jgi:hypothetical protein
VTTLWAVAVGALWGFVTIGEVSASTMPPPDEPASADVAEASEVNPEAAPPSEQAAEAPAGSSDEGSAGVADPTQSEVDADANAVAPPPPAASVRLPVDAIRPRIDVVGEVVGHPTGKVLLAIHDLVTLKLDRSQDAKPGDRYAIARREQFVEHPDSGRNMGYVVRVVATAALEQSFGRYWSARIVSSADYVTLDDWVIPFEPAVQGAGESASDRAGSIVAFRDDLVLAGEANVVYTDLGADEGAKPGDEFRVIRPGASGRLGGPDRRVGTLRILAVRPESSSAYLTGSSEPIMIGDRLEHISGTPTSH